MNCPEVQKFLTNDFLKKQNHKGSVEAHLYSCKTCRGMEKKLSTLQKAFRLSKQKKPDHSIKERVAKGIQDALMKENTKSKSRLLKPILAFGVLFLIAGLTYFYITSKGPTSSANKNPRQASQKSFTKKIKKYFNKPETSTKAYENKNSFSQQDTMQYDSQPKIKNGFANNFDQISQKLNKNLKVQAKDNSKFNQIEKNEKETSKKSEDQPKQYATKDIKDNIKKIEKQITIANKNQQKQIPKLSKKNSKKHKNSIKDLIEFTKKDSIKTKDIPIQKENTIFTLDKKLKGNKKTENPIADNKIKLPVLSKQKSLKEEEDYLVSLYNKLKNKNENNKNNKTDNSYEMEDACSLDQGAQNFSDYPIGSELNLLTSVSRLPLSPLHKESLNISTQEQVQLLDNWEAYLSQLNNGQILYGRTTILSHRPLNGTAGNLPQGQGQNSARNPTQLSQKIAENSNQHKTAYQKESYTFLDPSQTKKYLDALKNPHDPSYFSDSMEDSLNYPVALQCSEPSRNKGIISLYSQTFP